MKFILGIKPNVFSGWGTTIDANVRIRQIMQGAFVYSSQFGNAYTDTISPNPKYVYGYNIEVFKRGKHRNNKHYTIYRYAFPIEMFKLLNVEINQGPRTFKIKPKKR